MRDPRLDPYRDRACRLLADGEPTGYVLVETQEAQLKLGGALWWTRWDEPEEMAVLAVLLDGDIADGQTYVREELTALLEDWSRGLFVTSRATYEVEWLDDAETARVHTEVFGHHH